MHFSELDFVAFGEDVWIGKWSCWKGKSVSKHRVVIDLNGLDARFKNEVKAVPKGSTFGSFEEPLDHLGDKKMPREAKERERRGR